MADPKAQAAKQLANIEKGTGKTAEEFAYIVKEAGLGKHGQIVGYLKAEHGLTHGNANLLAHRVREIMDGGPRSDEDLLAAQYAGQKAHLRPILDDLCALAVGLGGDVEVVAQKTGVSLRRTKQFALVQAPSSKRVTLGLNLDETPDDERVSETAGMCSHRVVLTHEDEIDDDVAGWIRLAYERAG